MSMCFRVWTAALLILVASGFGCNSSDPASDHHRIDEAIEKLKSDHEKHLPKPAATKLPAPKKPKEHTISHVEDPCPEVPRAKNATMSEMIEGIQLLAACMRKITLPIGLISQAIEYMMAYQWESSQAGASKLSEMSELQLAEFLDRNFVEPLELFQLPSPLKAKLRTSFTDAELDEIANLVMRRNYELGMAELKIYAAMDTRPALIDAFAGRTDRYRLLQILKRTFDQGASGEELVHAIREVMLRAGGWTPNRDDEFSGYPISSYAILSLVPEEGHELLPLDPETQNPFVAVVRSLSVFGQTPTQVEEIRRYYSHFRAKDNPAMPKHADLSSTGVRVALMDSGIDFVENPELGLYLANGITNAAKASGYQSWDYADRDDNPWAPAPAQPTPGLEASIGFLKHGTFTASVLLNVIARFAPDILSRRAFEYSVWKTMSLRRILGGNMPGDVRWENRRAIQEAIIDQVENAAIKPKIVSASIQFPLWKFISGSKPDLLKKAPWLWVMSAGNGSRDISDRELSETLPACLNDVPEMHKNSERILCVGAIVPGILQNRVAEYTNFGAGVDVYTYDYYPGLCEGGASCSAAAISAVAAILAAKFPEISPAQIRKIIIDSSVTRVLPINWDLRKGYVKFKLEAGLLPRSREVKVFDPASMLGIALQKAEKASRIVNSDRAEAQL